MSSTAKLLKLKLFSIFPFYPAELKVSSFFPSFNLLFSHSFYCILFTFLHFTFSSSAKLTPTLKHHRVKLNFAFLFKIFLQFKESGKFIQSSFSSLHLDSILIEYFKLEQK